MSKLKLFANLFLLALIVFSCQNEEDFDSNELSKLKESESLKAFKENAPDGVFYSNFTLNTENHETSTRRRMCTWIPNIDNLTLCGSSNLVSDITATTNWNVLNNGPGYIDYELEELFKKSCYFSYRCIRPNGPPTQEIYGEVDFYESGSFNVSNGNYDLFDYLGDNISISNSNKVKEHFICAIREYRDTHLPGAIISEVDFYGDALLCMGETTKHLKASFKLSLHGS